MARKPKRPQPQDDSRLCISRFDGMRPNSDPHEMSPGTSVHQVNVMVGPPGELRVRLGCKPLSFD